MLVDVDLFLIYFIMQSILETLYLKLIVFMSYQDPVGRQKLYELF